jgi:hypothetical protein
MPVKPLHIFDPATLAAAVAATAPDPAARFVALLGQGEIGALIPNIPAKIMALRHGEQVFPLTVSDGGRGGSYVVQPHSAYIGYAAHELGHAGLGVWEPLARAGLGLTGGLLSAAGLNRIVMLDNFLVATSLHGDWDGAGLTDIMSTLTQQFPDHIIGIRSVDPWTCPELFAALRTAGWLLLPSRQIWVIDDMQRDWAARNHVKTDRRKLRQSELLIEELSMMSDSDAQRIAALYHDLYIAKYSPLNPQFTPAWIKLLHISGLVRFQVARSNAGQIMAVAGCMVRGDVMTVPVLGYDMARPQDEGLYRIASLMFGDFALENRLRLNGSAGAGEFKRLRGARSQVEYLACHIAHLSAPRQWVLRALRQGLERVAMPMMIAKGL